MPTQRRASLMDNQRTELQPSHDGNMAWKTACSLYQCLPGLRGFWPGSATTAYIVSPSFRQYVLDLGGYDPLSMEYIAANGTGRFGYDGLAPTVEVRGVGASGGAYCRCGNRPDYQILGIERYIESGKRGLTFGLWMKFSSLGSAQAMMGKDDGAGLSFSYYLERDASDYVRFVLTGDGSSRVGVTSSEPITDADDWHLVIARYYSSSPSAAIPEMSIFLNGVKAVETNGVPGIIYDSDAELYVGYPTQTAAGPTDAKRFSMVFISCMALSDGICGSIWHHSRAMFGR